MVSFENKVALVTGGASGIGLSFVDNLLKSGIKFVTICDFNEAGIQVCNDLSDKYGPGKLMFLKTDVNVDKQFEDAYKQTIDRWCHLDLVINCAGITEAGNWELCVDTNAKSVARSCFLALKYMKRTGEPAVVVNIASILGLLPIAAIPIYTATKHFVVGLTRAFGSDYYLQNYNVKFLTICPGITQTEMVNPKNADACGEMRDAVIQFLTTFPHQSTDKVGNSLQTILANAENGSAWVVEGGDPPYPVGFPDRTTYKPNNN